MSVRERGVDCGAGSVICSVALSGVASSEARGVEPASSSCDLGVIVRMVGVVDWMCMLLESGNHVEGRGEIDGFISMVDIHKGRDKAAIFGD